MVRTKYITSKGMRFSRLVLTGVAFSIKQSKYHEVRCDCGGITRASASALHRGKVKSCGCLNQENRCTKKGVQLNKRLPNNMGRYNDLIRSSKAKATERGYSWELTYDDCVKFFKSDCFYCGGKPSNIWRNKRIIVDILLYNGIDRVDNSEGYTINNSVACCGECNRMKSDLSLTAFYKKIKQIYETQISLRELI